MNEAHQECSSVRKVSLTNVLQKMLYSCLYNDVLNVRKVCVYQDTYVLQRNENAAYKECGQNILTTLLVYGELSYTNYPVINNFKRENLQQCGQSKCILEYVWHLLQSEGNPACTVNEYSAVGTASLFCCRKNSGFYGCYGSSCDLWLPDLSTCALNYTFAVGGSHQNTILEMLSSLFPDFYIQTLHPIIEL